MPASHPASRDDIRELEARFDARFQAVSARFVRVDNRFATVEARLDEIDRRHDTLAQRFDTRFQIVDARLDTTSAQIDDVRNRMGRIERHGESITTKVDRLGRVMVLGFMLVLLTNAFLWAGTVTVIA